MHYASILGGLIEKAVRDCHYYGCGDYEDEEYGSGLHVTAEWEEDSDLEDEGVICIAVFQDGVFKFSYEDAAIGREQE